MLFNPFENRLCRDVRNSIGHSLILSVNQRSFLPLDKAVLSFKLHHETKSIKEYIHYRKECLARLLKELKTQDLNNSQEYIRIFLWNHGLFFEFHELLEEEWKAAEGNEKKALQALILAAITYEHLTYHRMNPARKTAQKAFRLLKDSKEHLPLFLDPDLFISKLQSPDPDPPALIPGNGP